MSAEQIIREAIESSRPCLLLLGQSTSSKTTSVLDLLRERKSIDTPSAGWRDVLARGLSMSDYEWLSERYERTVASESFQGVLNLPWSAVFTSRIDPKLIRMLETRGRQPEAIASSVHHPRVPRSTSRPPVYYLFGRASEASDSTRCPSNPLELTRRLLQHASVLLARLSETATPLGLLVIDGYQPSNDWLPLEHLLGTFPVGEGMTILWLGPHADAEGSPLFADLRSTGRLHTDSRNLEEIVAEMQARGDFEPTSLPVLFEPGVISLANDAAVQIQPSLRLRVEASAAIVDDDWTKPPPGVSPVVEEALFSRFHGDPGGMRAIIEGVARGYCVKRDFEGPFQKHVTSALARPGSLDRIIVLHGQSGTGKTVALGALAFVVRTRLRAPVLVSARLPEPTDVDAFCSELERLGHGPTLILCDANLPYVRYFILADALRSRGRRFLLVGTSYRHDGQGHHPAAELIEAPDRASAAERESLAALVRRFGSLERAPGPEAYGGEHVFALLYRSISAARFRLSSGIGGEARFAEQILRDRALKPRPVRSPSLLAQKLVAAGFHSGEETLFAAVDQATHGQDTAGRLIDYVMIAGRLDIPVPINLLMRALRSRETALDFEQVAELFGDLDLFRRHTDAEQNELLISPRLRIEAELVCRRRLANSDRELECLVDLIRAVRPQAVDSDSELQFLVSLFQRIDREGPKGDHYADGYLRVAQALTTLRSQHGVEDARLMLQESHFRRAWLLSHQDEGLNVPPARRDEILDEARAAVEDALARIERKELHAGSRTRENLYVERASIYGYLAVGHAKANDNPEIVWSDYLAARVATRRAMTVAPSYFPFDIALWTPADVLRAAGPRLSESHRAELLADIYSTLDRIHTPDLPPGELERFHVRRTKLGTALDDSLLEQAAIADLEAINPPAAAYLVARSMAKETFLPAQPISESSISAARSASEYLRTRGSAVASDPRCSRLLLELEWVVATGQRLMRGERRRIPTDQTTRRNLLEIARTIESATLDALDHPIRYLSLVLTWLLGTTREAELGWRDLARETEFADRRRVVRRHVITDEQGAPVLHRGRLAQLRTPGHWIVDVEGVRGRVDLLERDFRAETFKVGFEIRGFCIAFNYLGPIADPPEHDQ